MYMSEWKEFDGYWESLVSFERSSNAIARLRAVLRGDGLYESCVREWEAPGRMLASGSRGLPLSHAAAEAISKFDYLCKKPLEEVKFPGV
jgi:hypothetical protein